jgi:hypothetical protein
LPFRSQLLPTGQCAFHSNAETRYHRDDAIGACLFVQPIQLICRCLVVNPITLSWNELISTLQRLASIRGLRTMAACR